MLSTEGSPRYIGESLLHAIDIRQSEPQDFFKLRLNSNDTYSRQFYPNNNCHDFIMKFPQRSADSVQYRISQCNRYQIINLRLPIRGNKGVQASYFAQVPFHSHVIKSIPNLPVAAGGVQYNTNIGRMYRTQYTETHEELEKIHLTIDCPSLNRQKSDGSERNFSKNFPPITKFISRMTREEII